MSNIFGYIPGSGGGNGDTIALTSDDTSGQYYIPFSKTTKKKGNKLYVDNSVTPLTYDPSTGTLTANIFAGGVAADDIEVFNTATGTPNYLIMSSTSSGVSTLKTSPAGATYNVTGNIASLNISGNAGTASQADQIKVLRNGNNAVHYLTFSDSNPDPANYINLHTNAGIKCNPSDDSITADTFIGALSGNASTASDILGGDVGKIVYQAGVDNTDFLPVGTANQVLISNGTGNAPSWSTDIQGNAASATLISTSSDVPADIYNVPFFSGTGAGRQLRTNALLQYDTTTTPAQLYTDINGTASNVTVTANASSTVYYPTFAAAGGGSQTLRYSTGSIAFSYIPDVGTITANEVKIGRGSTPVTGSVYNLFMGISAPVTTSFTLFNGRVTTMGNFAGRDMNTSAHWNTLVGDSAGLRITSGAGNTCIGVKSGPFNTAGTGNDNVFIGTETGFWASSGAQNVCIGSRAGIALSSGSLNTFIGNLSGPQNTANLLTGSNNVGIGYQAGKALRGGAALGNTLIGSNCGSAVTTGYSNICIGDGAGSGITINNNNVIIGNGSADLTSYTGNNNVVVGNNSFVNGSGSYNIIIGSSVNGLSTDDNILIGTATQTLYLQGAFALHIGDTITNSTNGDLTSAFANPLAQFYHVSMSLAGQTITLPNPALPKLLGVIVTFKRRTVTTAFTLTSTGGLGFIPIGSVTLSASPHTVAATVFQVTLMADGVNWNIINQA